MCIIKYGTAKEKQFNSENSVLVAENIQVSSCEGFSQAATCLIVHQSHGLVGFVGLLGEVVNYGLLHSFIRKDGVFVKRNTKITNN